MPISIKHKPDLEAMDPIDRVRDHDSPHVTDNSLS